MAPMAIEGINGTYWYFTVVGEEACCTSVIPDIVGLFKTQAVSRNLRLFSEGVEGVQFELAVNPTITNDLKAEIISLEKKHRCNIFYLTREQFNVLNDPSKRKLAIFDMDSTLIQMEVIDEIAKRRPEIADKVAEITADAMAGLIDFSESLRRRVALLKGIEIETVWREIKATCEITKGAKALMSDYLKGTNGWTTAVVSGGFEPIAFWLQEKLGLTFAFANQLECDKVGYLTGRVINDTSIVDSAAKSRHLTELAVGKEFVVAVGDGANDIPMLSLASVGIAFNAKPVVQERVQFRLNSPSLLALKYILYLNK